MIDIKEFVRLRKAKNWSQAELARHATHPTNRRLKVSQQLIGEIEAGRVKSTKLIYRIAGALETQAHKLDPDIPPYDERFADLVREAAELDEKDSAWVLKNLRDNIDYAKSRPVVRTSKTK